VPRFEKKIALITGAARGQGRHYVVRLAGEGEHGSYLPDRDRRADLA
jgi:NAD(P)-dependent dehydrogenase (short-subunit alcohol dehydrogenase family)